MSYRLAPRVTAAGWRALECTPAMGVLGLGLGARMQAELLEPPTGKWKREHVALQREGSLNFLEPWNPVQGTGQQGRIKCTLNHLETRATAAVFNSVIGIFSLLESCWLSAEAWLIPRGMRGMTGEGHEGNVLCKRGFLWEYGVVLRFVTGTSTIQTYLLPARSLLLPNWIQPFPFSLLISQSFLKA